jgi:predicted RNA-binding Zn-ribbon protein involved in translation (DUF1610 family)
MGEQITLLDVARDLIRLSGLVPEEDIKIEFIGLRPGEKLYEELVGAGESAGPSKVEKIQKVTTVRAPLTTLADAVAALEAHAAANRSNAVLQVLRDLIPEYGVPDELAVPGPEPGPAVDEVPAPVTEQWCPKCASPHVHRSRARNAVERLRRDWKHERLYRCDDCGWRGWLMPLAFGAASTEPVAVPDLASLDKAEDALVTPAAPAFAPRDLR